MYEEEDDTGRYWRCLSCGTYRYGADRRSISGTHSSAVQAFTTVGTFQQRERDHRRAVALQLKHSGLTAREIGERLSMTPRTIYKYLKGE
jgi:DNA-binding NarL/FixJ family response regulator